MASSHIDCITSCRRPTSTREFVDSMHTTAYNAALDALQQVLCADDLQLTSTLGLKHGKVKRGHVSRAPVHERLIPKDADNCGGLRPRVDVSCTSSAQSTCCKASSAALYAVMCMLSINSLVLVGLLQDFIQSMFQLAIVAAGLCGSQSDVAKEHSYR